MPEDPDHQEDGDQQVGIKVSDLRALRTIAKEHEQLKQQQAQAQRELAFAKAKLDLTDPKMGYFIKGYDGELEPEKIREAAVQAGFLQQEETTPKSELDAHSKLGAASAGAGDSAEQDLLAAINDAKSPEEVMRIMVAAGGKTSWNRPND